MSVLVDNEGFSFLSKTFPGTAEAGNRTPAPLIVRDQHPGERSGGSYNKFSCWCCYFVINHEKKTLLSHTKLIRPGEWLITFQHCCVWDCSEGVFKMPRWLLLQHTCQERGLTLYYPIWVIHLFALRARCCTDEGDTEVFIVCTHCVSAVELLQEGVVCAFGEATFLVDKSQHAQFLKRETDGRKRVKLIAVMTELVVIPGSLH